MAEFKPQQYGKFILLDRIARGGMAELYRAKSIGSKGFEKLVAIKKILPHLADQEEFVAAFIDEARLAAFLQHHNIVQIFDFGEMAGSYFISMEYLSGLPLRTVMNKATSSGPPFDLRLVFYIIAQICAGLHYAHNLKDFAGSPLNIIHRDMGPQNIFITYDGQVKIIDFGIARAASHNSATSLGSLKGKLSYMSPEQAGGLEIDHRSDIFSVGISLYELATGQHMYTGDSQQLLGKAANASFTPAREIREDLPPRLYAIIDKALARNPNLRHQSAEEMQADIDDCARQYSNQATAKDLASFMAELFRDETALEEQALCQAADIELPYPEDAAEATATLAQEETIFLPLSKPATPPWRLILLGALLITLTAAALWLPKVRDPLEHFLVTRLEQSGIISFPAAPSHATVDQYAAAKAFFTTLLADQDPPAGARHLPSPDLAEFEKHASFLVGNKPEEAYEILRKLTKKFPETALAHFLLGRLYTFRQQPDRAMDSYLKATELDPKLTEAFFNLGYLYAKNNDYLTAEKMYTQVIRLAPPYRDEALFNLAIIKKNQGDNAASLNYARQAVVANPNNQQAAKLINRLTETR
ncbi:MAG: protein kinase [Desulfobulbaceae bacterium]|nr:protein kinase [Desulfobulbaceae bacterium]HIJ78300.1 protein kinase [Deltaproteobacteria bacterium]